MSISANYLSAYTDQTLINAVLAVGKSTPPQEGISLISRLKRFGVTRETAKRMQDAGVLVVLSANREKVREGIRQAGHDRSRDANAFAIRPLVFVSPGTRTITAFPAGKREQYGCRWVTTGDVPDPVVWDAGAEDTLIVPDAIEMLAAVSMGWSGNVVCRLSYPVLYLPADREQAVRDSMPSQKTKLVKGGVAVAVAEVTSDYQEHFDNAGNA